MNQVCVVIGLLAGLARRVWVHKDQALGVTDDQETLRLQSEIITAIFCFYTAYGDVGREVALSLVIDLVKRTRNIAVLDSEGKKILAELKRIHKGLSPKKTKKPE